MRHTWIQFAVVCALAGSAGACSKCDPDPRPEPGLASAKLLDRQATNQPDATSAVAASAQCTSLCRKTATLKCVGEADCLRDCATMRQALRVCESSLEAVFSCMLMEPLDHFICQEEGIPGVQDAYCASEQAALVSCISNAEG